MNAKRCLTASEVESIFYKTGAVMEGHFLLTSGLHSPVYWENFASLNSLNIHRNCAL